MQTSAILRAVDRSGAVSFWTGRAGAAWVSDDRAEAFAALSLEGARRKAMLFNEREPLTGLRFIAIPADGVPE